MLELKEHKGEELVHKVHREPQAHKGQQVLRVVLRELKERKDSKVLEELKELKEHPRGIPELREQQELRVPLEHKVLFRVI